MASQKMNLVCNECGKRFKVSPSNPDPQCPQCGGVDVDVAEVSFYRNYSKGPFDFAEAS